MSKSNKPAAVNRADEIKGLLLDVIQQEDSSMSESQVIRLSKPYESPIKKDIADQEEPNFGEVTQPKINALLDKETEPQGDEKTHSKIELEIAPELEFDKPKKQFQVKTEAFSPEKTVRLGSVPQSRSPIELRPKEASSESTVRLHPRANPRIAESESRIASGSLSASVQSKFNSDVQIAASSPIEAILKQSESLRIAQTRISSLEEELDKLRRENSQLSSAGEILRRRADELLSQTESLDYKVQEANVIFEEEKKVLKAQLANKEKDLEARKQKIDGLEQRVNTQFESIRRRERELEHRLEILKIENQDILNGKDKMILDLKRQVDLLNNEAVYSKERTQELYSQHKNKQETIRRVVKALRMALTILEGDEDSQSPLKKVD
jgi:hypothetical protein